MSRTAEEWGRLAVSLPGWRWMAGMQTLSLPTPGLPDPDDPATAGCLLALLGVQAVDVVCPAANGGRWAVSVSGPHHIGIGSTLGRACIAAAEALGRWPNGGRMVAE